MPMRQTFRTCESRLLWESHYSLAHFFTLKKVSAIAFAILAFIMLALGYSADWRCENYQRGIGREVRAKGKAFHAELRSKTPSLYQNDPTDAQLKPLEDIQDAIEARGAHVSGVIQYCSGWILFGIAALLWAVSNDKK